MPHHNNICHGLMLIVGMLLSSTMVAQSNNLPDGVAYITSVDGKFGLSQNIDGVAVVLVAPTFNRIERLKKNLFRVRKNDHFGLVNGEGEELLAPYYEHITAPRSIGNFILIRKDGLYGALHADGTKALARNFQHLEIIAEGHLLAKQNNLWMLYGPDLEQLFERAYDEVTYDSRGKKYVARSGEQRYIVGLDGQVKDAPIYDQVDRCFEGYCRVRIGEKWGYANADGKIVVPLEYEWIDDRVRQGIARATKNGKMGWIRPRSNEVILDFKYDEVDIASSIAKVVFMKNDGKTGWLNKRGEVIVPPTYSDVLGRSSESGIYLVVSPERQYGLVTWENEVLLPLQANKLGTVYNGLVTYREAERWGVMTIWGERKTPPRYDHPPGIIETYGFIIVQADGLYGLIDRAGEEVLPIIYQSLRVEGVYKGAAQPMPIIAQVGKGDGIYEELELKVIPLDDK